MDKFKILLNCNICKDVFDSEYKLMKHMSKFHLPSFFQIVTFITITIIIILIIAIVVILLIIQNNFKDYAIQFK